MVRMRPITNGTFGRDLIIKRKCGCKNAYAAEKIAKYTMYGVNRESRLRSANKNA